MKRIILGVAILAILLIPASATQIKATDEQVSLFTMLAKNVLGSNGINGIQTNVSEMDLSFTYYVDLNGDGLDNVVSTKIHIGKAIYSKIRVGDASFNFSGIAIAYPISDMNNDGLRDVIINKILGLGEPSGVEVYSKDGLLWNYSKTQSIVLAIPDNKSIVVSQIMVNFAHPSTEIVKFNSSGNATMKYVMSGLGYALPLDDVNSDGTNDLLIVKMIDVLPNGNSTSGAFIVDGSKGRTISRHLETSEKEMITTIGQVVRDLDGDGVKDVILQLMKQDENGFDVLLKVVSSKKAVKWSNLNDALLWQKELQNFVSVTVVNDVDGDNLPDIGVVTYKPSLPKPSVVYPTQATQEFDYKFDIYRGYDGKHLAHFEFTGK